MFILKYYICAPFNRSDVMRKGYILSKKSLALLLAHFMLLTVIVSVLSLQAIAAADVKTEIKLTASTTAPTVGDTVTVTVSISGNTGFAAIQFDVIYDTKVLSCTDARTGAVLKKASLAASNPEDDGRITVAAATLDEIADNGVVAVISFKAKGAGDAGLSLEMASLCDIDYKDLVYSVSSDKVVVKSADSTSNGGTGSQTGGTSTGDDNNTGEADGQVYMLSDISKHWAAKEIERISSLGLITGFEDGSFKPNDLMTRAQFAVILWRMAGKPEPKGKAVFTDLKADWYVKAVTWASENGYINGKASALYAPDSYISRQELAVILYRYSGGTPGVEAFFYTTYDNLFSDSKTIAAWGRSAMYWAVYKEYIKGVTETELSPEGQATRAQVATIISRYLNSN
jgi:hypothetical protein